MANSHKRDTDARRKPRAALVAGPLALLATASAVTIGVMSQDSGSGDVLASQSATTDISRPTRDAAVSRSSSRMDAGVSQEQLQRAFDANVARLATAKAVKQAHTKLWTTTPLNLWTTSDEAAEQVGLLDERKQVLITGRKADGRDEVVVDGQSRWVTSGYLAEDKPVVEKPEPKATEKTTSAKPSTPAAPAGLSTAPCPDSSVESGLPSEAVMVYRAVCNAFPQIDTYLGYDAHGEHASGQAIDIMTSDKALGDQIAAFLQSHASELDLYDIIWWDQIWTPVRASEGWRYYGDHGSATANHMDHVHVSTNG